MTADILSLKVLVAEEDYRFDLCDWNDLSNEERVRAELDANNSKVTNIFVQIWYVKKESMLQASLNELLGRSWVVVAWLEEYVPRSQLKDAESKLAWTEYIGKGPKHLGDN